MSQLNRFLISFCVVFQQVPDSQEGAEPEEQPLVGLSHRIPSMLRKVPERSAMASPEKKRPERGRRVAFMEQVCG